jgi:hypothetical protein
MDEKLPHFVIGKSANLLRQDGRDGVKLQRRKERFDRLRLQAFNPWLKLFDSVARISLHSVP